MLYVIYMYLYVQPTFTDVKNTVIIIYNYASVAKISNNYRITILSQTNVINNN